MKIGVIIPTRGDRPKLLANCMRLMKAQTLQPEIIVVVDYEPISQQKDITPRYRNGYEQLRNKGLDLIAFIEDDEFYAPDYLEIMGKSWLENNKPDLLGTSSTIYYHLLQRGFFIFHHDIRSSAMSTLIKPDLDLTWPADHDPYVDLHLWLTLAQKDLLSWAIVTPDKVICIGMKHGFGLCGGDYHTDNYHRYTEEFAGRPDPELSWLQKQVDPESFKFYNSIANENITYSSVQK